MHLGIERVLEVTRARPHARLDVRIAVGREPGEVSAQVRQLVRHREPREAMEDHARPGVPAAPRLDVHDRRDDARRHALRGRSPIELAAELLAAPARRGDARRAQETPVQASRLARGEPEVEPVERLHPRVVEGAFDASAVESVHDELLDERTPPTVLVRRRAGGAQRQEDEDGDGDSADHDVNDIGRPAHNLQGSGHCRRTA